MVAWNFAPVRYVAVAVLGLVLGGCPVPHDVRPAEREQPVVRLDSLALPVSAAENRPVAFTNKRSAYYYTQTHRNDHPEHAYFRGLNIAGRRIFSDYQISAGGAPLDPRTATVVVRPDALVRTYAQGSTATLRLFDRQDAVEVEVTGAPSPVSLTLSGDTLTAAGPDDGLDWYESVQDAAAATRDYVAVGRRGDRFLIVVGPSREAARRQFAEAAAKHEAWTRERRERLEGVVNGDHYLWTSDPQLTRALRWLALTTDALITRQRGDGIYAGLPWFNEYWGRDTFISLPGAALVTGHFEEARAILTSFAQFQDLDPQSRYYGRLPNIVKPGAIDYHTTDGTPRWVIALRDYVHYSGDRTIVTELYPSVKASIEGALGRWTDASGYLVHADNETWMDARREPDKASYSPRSTRANDIQALWYAQLRAGAEFAAANDDPASAARWAAAAERVRSAFTRDFVEPATGRIADHLDARNVASFQLRPNLLFTLPMLGDDAVAARALGKAWQALVYPWGVATLDQADPGFHPYHLAPGHYHKDAAYHNGAVWPWLNGIAMQRMVELGRPDLAWRLFAAMNGIVLQRGVVGGLPENLDAYPHPGAADARLTGTFLQAWSNAEQLRVWYQDFLGIQPDLARGEVRLVPRLPGTFGDAEFTARIGAGRLRARYDHEDGKRRYAWRLEGQAARMEVDIEPFDVAAFDVAAGELHVRRFTADGAERDTVRLQPSAHRRERQAALGAILADVEFAAPGNADAHPAMHQVSTP